MRKSEVKELEDKDLQLRYFIGGLKTMTSNEFCHYWICDIDCSCNIVPDDERLDEVKKFIKKHNITNERFLKLSYNYLIGTIMKYPVNYSNLFIGLSEVLKPYGFVQSNRKEIPNNDFRQKELEKLINSAYEQDSIVGNFIKKYNLTVEDFVILAKTILNYNIYGLGVSNPNDTFITEIKDIIKHYDLSMPKEFVEEYRKAYQNRQEPAELFIETKSAQKKYLELMKELIIKDSASATELITDELRELGIINKKDIKRLIRKK